MRRTQSIKKQVSARFLQLEGLSDSELVALTDKGSPEAFQVLADRYEALVRSIASKYLGLDSMTIEDVCQETFLKALVKIGDLRDTSRFRSWLCMIARNQALDAGKKRSVLISYESCDDDSTDRQWEIADTDSNPAEIHAHTEVERVMKDVMRNIPEMYLKPISMRFEQDMDYEDIAYQLGRPLGTIKSLIHRGKALIRKEVTRRAWGIEGAHAFAS
jgi:RNA polymerase sigma factor (sigma-70 family)